MPTEGSTEGSAGSVPRQLSRELLDAGTAIGANVEESIAAQSRADFVSKCSIAHKEARETRYWLRLIAAADPEMATEAGPLAAEAGELIAILGAMVRNARISTPRR